jgi:DNA modification methylase
MTRPNPIPMLSDATPEGLAQLRRANAEYRKGPWPAPFDDTTHRLHKGDARDLSWLPDESAHLVVTSPPYWTLKTYAANDRQMGAIEDYEQFLRELDRVWAECYRVLVPGGRICCVVGDVCMSRKKAGRHYVVPLHADIQVRSRKIGLDCLTPIIWHKIANGVTEAEGNGAGFYGKPFQPGAVVKNDIEYILFLRKGGSYRTPTPLQKALSVLTKQEMQDWWRSIWVDIKGTSTRAGHPAPYPVELAERLIRMFSFAGDTVLDPFVGTGSTNLAALASGRNSIGNEIESTYLKIAHTRLLAASQVGKTIGAVWSSVSVDNAAGRDSAKANGIALSVAGPLS